MKIENSIGWCDDTGNKVIGCAKVSPGCKNCYAETGTIARVMRGRGRETWGPKGGRVPVAGFSAKLRRLNQLCICDQCHETQPFAHIGQECGHCPPGSILADDECTGTLRRLRFFADSNSDWLDEKWAPSIFQEFIGELTAAPNVDILLLTKRIELLRQRMSLLSPMFYPLTQAEFPKHIWLGISVENQEMADKRRPFLEKIAAPVWFVSYEPALDRVDWRGWEFIDWMIAGLESGAARRDGGVICLSGAAEWCAGNKIPIYIKQDCAFKSGQQGRIPDEL